MTQNTLPLEKSSSPESNNHSIPFNPGNTIDAFAHKIAVAFHDENHLPLYLFYCRRYGKEPMEKIFNEVQSIPDERIKKSRPALFVFLAKKYAKSHR